MLQQRLWFRYLRTTACEERFTEIRMNAYILIYTYTYTFTHAYAYAYTDACTCTHIKTYMPPKCMHVLNRLLLYVNQNSTKNCNVVPYVMVSFCACTPLLLGNFTKCQAWLSRPVGVMGHAWPWPRSCSYDTFQQLAFPCRSGGNRAGRNGLPLVSRHGYFMPVQGLITRNPQPGIQRFQKTFLGFSGSLGRKFKITA